MSQDHIRKILEGKFPFKHVNSALNHFSAVVINYQRGNWESTLQKVGKFVEAIMKCLAIYCNIILPRSRNFKVGVIAKNLESASSQYDDIVRLLIPKACLFIYDISSNRGARHDPDEINPNAMDAGVSISVASWILAELIRFSTGKDARSSILLIEALSSKKYPKVEEIGERIYINIRGMSARHIGILIMNAIFPRRIKREKLIDLIIRHGFKRNAASVATQRMKAVIDENDEGWKLRGLGREEADEIFHNIMQKL